MRPVSAASSKLRTRGRTTASRRTAATRGASGRSAHNRTVKSRGNPVSRLLHALGTALILRRPAVIAATLIAVAGGAVFLFLAGYVHRTAAAAQGRLAAIAGDAGLTISAIHITGNRYE
ncbi:MAG: hypothetical protein JOY77_13310, partial [Alphaproteobacteria bacterium]|nr:hypothetical protein [Alphaproteobacteria bacterium]